MKVYVAISVGVFSTMAAARAAGHAKDNVYEEELLGGELPEVTELKARVAELEHAVLEWKDLSGRGS